MITKRPLTLVQKAVILVTVPLLFEFVVLLMCVNLLHQSEIDVRETDHSKAVIAKTNEVIEELNDVGIWYIIYDADTKPIFGDKYTGSVAKLRAGLEALAGLIKDDGTQLTADDEKQLTVVRNVTAESEESLAILDGEMTKIKAGGRIDLAVAEKLQENLKEVETSLIEGVIDPEKVAQERVQAQRSKGMLRVVLILGAWTPILFFGILVLIQRHTSKRLGALIDNGIRLGRGEPLGTVLEAGDEISQIDAVFHEAADKLREAARKERAVVDNAADVICSIDGNGSFIAVSPASEKLWGYKPVDLVGKSWLEFIHSEDVTRAIAWSDNLRKTASDGVLEMRVVRKDGTLIDVRWSSHWSAAERSMFCVVHDISERLELERFKQQFVATISHDLRTPLSAVKSTLELLGAGTWGELSEHGQTKVARAEDNLRHTIDLINNLLDLEKMEAAKIELNKVEVALDKVLKQSGTVVAPLAEAKSVKLEIPEVDVVLNADEQRLSQVIINLLGNAIKFSPHESTVKVDVDVKNGGRKDSVLNDSPNMVRVSVTDKGTGIPAEMRELIFDRYRQLPATPGGGKPSVGTGLGLAICKEIVEAHGGRIGVDSEEGAGSTFWFELPA